VRTSCPGTTPTFERPSDALTKLNSTARCIRSLTSPNEDRDNRLVKFDREAYRRRNIVERLIGWLKECRRVFSRFEKTAKNFGGIIKIAFIERYLRLCTS